MSIDFKDKVIVITGAGGGLGKAYALWFGGKGAKVVVNDLGGSATGGEGGSTKNADVVVDEIKKAGGDAVANYDSVTDGDKIIKTAVDAFGTVHILINNAGILRDKSFKSMTEKDWDLIYQVHIYGAFKCAHAAWPYFRKQKFGRIVNTASAAGLYGNFGQANYSAAKLALVTFAKTLAIEGAKYNILANAIAPIAASRLTETVMPPEMLESLKPDYIVPLVANLVADDSKTTGQVFEAGAGFYAALRHQRSKGAVFSTDDSFTPSAVLARWDEINDFDSEPEYPQKMTDADHLGHLEMAKGLKSNKQADKISFEGKVAIVSGAGNGLGKAYALMLGKHGASVVVNDMNGKAASAVVDEITKAGGKAVVDTNSVVEGEKLVQTALEKFGGVHILINNAGILRDKSFASMSDEKEWKPVLDTHLHGTFAVCKAAWPHLQKQKYGRIVNTCSAVGIYGNFGQANYSTAKAAIWGLSKTLAIEGKKANILVNTIAPNAGTAMTATIWPEEMVQAFKPDFVAPVVGYLVSEANQETTQGIFEISGGWAAAVRWQRSGGAAFSIKAAPSPEQLRSKWDKITGFGEDSSYPTSTQESLEQIISNFGNEEETGDEASGASGGETPSTADPEDPEIVAEAKKNKIEPSEYTYTERDVALYNLGLGATEQERQWTWEGDDDFHAIPTFGVIPQFAASSSLPLDWLPNFSPMMLLHGEQYLEIRKAIPTSGTLTNHPYLLEVLDKGKAAAVTSATDTKDSNGEIVFHNESTVFIRGSGGFKGKKQGKDRGPASAANKPPSRKPDVVVEERTLERQAAIYRLSGDYNPLHIDPEFASVGGFKKPILHGLCSFGIAGKHILKAYGPFKNIKVRFTGTVDPGQTLVTEMWKEGGKVIFITKVKETGSVAISAAAAELVDPDAKGKEVPSSGQPIASTMFSGPSSDSPKPKGSGAETSSSSAQVLKLSRQDIDPALIQAAEAAAKADPTIVAPDFDSSAVMALVQSTINSGDIDKKDLLKRTNAIYEFRVTKSGKEQIWTADMKKSGKIIKGKGSKKPTVTISMADRDLVDLATQ